MKKRIAILLLLALTLVSAGCGKTPAQEQSTPAPTAAPEAAPAQTAIEKAPAEPAQENKSLVVAFSCTGTTRGVAEKIAALTGAELVDLIPAQPYTAEDLNYNDRSTRATVEQNTPDARPEIASDISLNGVTTLYLGYPIWWGQAPRIMSTFVESHDFISGCRHLEDLPKAARDYIAFIESAVGCPICYVSVGAERDAIIVT